MDDHEIVDLYWQRDEHAIEATAAKYESYCMKISQNILSDRADSCLLYTSDAADD